jgi:hypothetical protein
MRIRMRNDGAVISDSEFRSLYPNTSFQSALSDELLDTFEADIVFEGPQPILALNQYSQYDGVEQIDGKWFTKYIATNYTEEEISNQLNQWRQQVKCTPFQGKAALYNAGLLDDVNSLITSGNAITKLAWENALEWKRISPMIESLSASLGLSETQVDDLFRAAVLIEA